MSESLRVNSSLTVLFMAGNDEQNIIQCTLVESSLRIIVELEIMQMNR